MINFISSSLQGDGIHPDFFHHLWLQNRNDEDKNDSDRFRLGETSSRCCIRIPDTVTFRLGQPLQWYFINERNQRISILKKRKKNLSVEKIEQVFLRKARASVGEHLTEHDIVAYFVASSECTSRNRAENGVCNETISCDVEYLNAEQLRESYIYVFQTTSFVNGLSLFIPSLSDDFLYTRRKNQSGILQRFMNPSGGGKNSQIQALCTTKMCILERRRNKQDIRDTRYGLYERAVTFEGPETYSTLLPIRGKALSGVIEELCYQVIDVISKSCGSSNKDDIRMVLNLKVDENEKVWILYSTSIRCVAKSDGYNKEFSTSAAKRTWSKNTVNMNQLITLAPSVKLSEYANHDSAKTISNEKIMTICPSCNEFENNEHFQPVMYKTIISHFEQVIEISGKQGWPPREDIIKAGRNIGFGRLKNLSQSLPTEEDLLIPPVIRTLHPRLGCDGYKRYRIDSLFLHKECKMCESCFLSYAELVSNSYKIKKSVQVHDDVTYSTYIGPTKRLKSQAKKASSCSTNKFLANLLKNHEKISTIFSDLIIQGPSLPSAITNPPLITYESDIKKLLPLPYDEIETPKQPLIHLIQLEAAKKKSRCKTKDSSENINPYKVPLTLIGERSSKKRKKMKKSFEVLSNQGKDKDNHPLEKQNERTIVQNRNMICILSNALEKCKSVND